MYSVSITVCLLYHYCSGFAQHASPLLGPQESRREAVGSKGLYYMGGMQKTNITMNETSTFFSEKKQS